MHKTIQIKDLTLSHPHKTCFNEFNTQVVYGNRIAIIGRNGSGKTSLLKLILGSMEPTHGVVIRGESTIRIVPQIIEEFNGRSGGQRFNLALTKALGDNPNVLLLDEPTNHLDKFNRMSLIRMLQAFNGTVIVASHDTELLRNCFDTLWHIENGHVGIFHGIYDDYIREKNQLRNSLEQEITRLNQQKRAKHSDLMKEQKRAAKSKTKGEKSIHRRKWPSIVSSAKATRAQETSGNKKSAISIKKQNLIDKISNLSIPEIMRPKFSLISSSISSRPILSVNEGSIGFSEHEPILQKISLLINSKDRVSIQGINASGKTTLIKAIMKYDNVIRTGCWHMPNVDDIGYLDQHYASLTPEHTVFETIVKLMPNWTHIEIRRHLNDFLFRKNEEVYAPVAALSGGEKARLSLAKIAAHTPKILILDEITNNLDIETREHVVEVLKQYPGAIIVISHDSDFLKKIEVNRYLEINNNNLHERSSLT